MAYSSIAGHYTETSGDSEGLMQRVQQAYQALRSAAIPGLVEIETSRPAVRVLVDPAQRNHAREVLKDILPQIPREMKMRVDASSIRRVTPASPHLLPGDEILVGSSSVLPSGVHSKLVVIQDDSKIERQHLKVRWDGLSKLEAQDVSRAKDAKIGGTVEIGPEWMEIEPGAKIQIGDTSLIFQLGESTD